MAAGASQLDSKYGGKFGCNLTRFGGAVNGNMGGRSGWGSATSLLASLPGAIVLDDEDYAIEEQKEEFDDDPTVLAMPKDRKREMEKERQAFREERKRMRKEEQPTKADDRAEKKRELNPLLKIKSKDGAAAVSGSLEEEALPASEAPPADAERPAMEPADAKIASAYHSVVEAAEQTSSAFKAATEPPTQTQAAIGGLLGGYASDEDSSDLEESAEISNYNYLNLNLQEKMPPKVPSIFKKKTEVAAEVAEAMSKVSSQRRFPLPKCRSPASNSTLGEAPKVETPPASGPLADGAGMASSQRRFPLPQRRFPLPKFRSPATSEDPGMAAEEVKAPATAAAPAKMDTLMKEVSPALAALMSGSDC
mmetsp:Transcript_152934/g.281504  ORF Transcript_152934/g.281504 Transcript_152934/m.281504 type:complete len:365 (-) Transcript_152934:50-1144(-)